MQYSPGIHITHDTLLFYFEYSTSDGGSLSAGKVLATVRRDFWRWLDGGARK